MALPGGGTLAWHMTGLASIPAITKQTYFLVRRQEAILSTLIFTESFKDASSIFPECFCILLFLLFNCYASHFASPVWKKTILIPRQALSVNEGQAGCLATMNL